MKVQETNSLSMAEAKEYLDKENNSELIGFMKKFSESKLEDAKQLRENIEKLDLMKVNEKHISKLIDLLPGNIDELNKIFTDVGLDEDESNKILSAVKEFK